MFLDQTWSSKSNRTTPKRGYAITTVVIGGLTQLSELFAPATVYPALNRSSSAVPRGLVDADTVFDGLFTGSSNNLVFQPLILD